MDEARKLILKEAVKAARNRLARLTDGELLDMFDERFGDQLPGTYEALASEVGDVLNDIDWTA